MTLAWIDTETTGLNPRPWYNDQGERRDPATLLEVACIITDDNFKEIARYQAVTDEARRVNFDHVEQVVLDMHAQNGLWGESLSKGRPLHEIDNELEAFLEQHGVTEETVQVDANLTKHRKVYPQLAGSTVSFDRGFLEIYLPKSAAQLHYRNVDVTTINEIARRVWPTAHEKRPNNKGVAHRAMPDIEESLRVGAYYASVLGHADTCAAAGAAYAVGRISGSDAADTRYKFDLVTSECVAGKWRAPREVQS